MKPATFSTQPQSVIAIYADDKIGLLGQLLNLFNRPYFKIGSLNVARTDVSDIVLITLEAEISGQALTTMLRKLEKIVEVYKAIAWPAEEASLNKVGYYRVALEMPPNELETRLQQHGAAITKIFTDSIIIQKTGTTKALKKLYDELDGQYLISYCETGLIVERSLVQLDEFFCEPMAEEMMV